jgi:hypothetical protein
MKLRQELKPRPGTNDPWQILVVAVLFFIPGIALLLSSTSVAAYRQGSRWLSSAVEVASPETLHGYGIVALLMSAAVFLFYLSLRREIMRDEQALKNRKRR